MLDQLIQKHLANKTTQEEKKKLDYDLNMIFYANITNIAALLQKNPSLINADRQELIMNYFKSLPLSKKLLWWNTHLTKMELLRE